MAIRLRAVLFLRPIDLCAVAEHTRHNHPQALCFYLARASTIDNRLPKASYSP